MMDLLFQSARFMRAAIIPPKKEDSIQKRNIIINIYMGIDATYSSRASLSIKLMPGGGGYNLCVTESPINTIVKPTITPMITGTIFFIYLKIGTLCLKSKCLIFIR